MTIKRVREIFGEKVDSLSDSELTSFISGTNVLCDGLLKIALKSLTARTKDANLNEGTVL